MQPYTKVQLLFPYCMTVPVTPNGDVGSGRTCVGGDTRKEEMRRSWFSDGYNSMYYITLSIVQVHLGQSV